jgi:thiol-disulfide isomerase/thioredoxin
VDRVLVLLAVLALTGLAAAWWRARDGRVIGFGAGAGGGARADGSTAPPTAADLAAAVRPATRLALVQFTAPDCHPCTTTRALLDEVAADRADLSVHALDVAEALDLARAHRVLRAPTTLLVTDDGHLLGRVSGVPRADELRALLDAA